MSKLIRLINFYCLWFLGVLSLSLPLLLISSARPSQAAEPGPPQLTTLSNPDPAQGSPTGEGLWRDVLNEAALRAKGVEPAVLPRHYRLLAADMAALDELLAQAPAEGSPSAQSIGPILTLPLPDGMFQQFRIVAYASMAPTLAEQFPEIKTYLGWGLDDPTATVRLDRTPAGFHGMILSNAGTVYIDPYRQGDLKHYISYFQRDSNNRWPGPIDEGFDQVNPVDQRPRIQPTAEITASTGKTLREYRLAVAATGEYTQFYGGTVDGALAAINTTVNRLNGLYERELSVRLILIANTTQLIYTNPDIDPYTNGTPWTMFSENQANVDKIIGSANYDVGHVFGTESGGSALIRSVCRDSSKAQGATGFFGFTPEQINIWLVAHEMSHQFGANHTFNAANAGACTHPGNRSPGTAYEPGSGSTIMSYGNGICDTQNLDDPGEYFHGVSLTEMSTHINNASPGGGATCGTPVATGNLPPNVEAGPNYTIPRQTPFTLNGSATDPDGDLLTYAWEEFDLGPPPDPHTLPNTDSDGNARPIFRSYPPVFTSSRTFPALTNILDGSYQNKGEALPAITRTMQFRLTVRDNKGGTGYDMTIIRVVSVAGPFRVTLPNTPTVWLPSTQQTVTWDVANTNLAPVSCSQVNILLSLDRGNSFPITLVSRTPNDGSQTFTLPDIAPATVVIKVECAGNIFFNISQNDLSVCSSVWRDDHEDGFAGWPVSNGQGNNSWQGQSNNSNSYSGSNYWFVADSDNIFRTDSYLDSPTITATHDYLLLSFLHKYSLEEYLSYVVNDGGVVEIRVNNGVWTDVGSVNFIKNGYNRTINTDYGSPIARRQAFSGQSNGYIESVVDLSNFVQQGDIFQIRFREANDGGFVNDVAKEGWFIDDVTVCGGPNAPRDLTNLYLPLILK